MAFYSPDKPWYRMAKPVEFPKGRLKADWVGKLNTSDTADGVLRSHLIPLHPKDNSYMAAWRLFWRALAFGDRTNIDALLQSWLADTTAALASGDLPEDEARAARAFRGDVEQSLSRIEKAKNEPLGWAGAIWAKYSPESRVAIEALVGAIVLHREGELSNEELYQVLDCLNLDPTKSPRTINADNLEKIFNSIVNGDELELESVYAKS